MYSPEAVIQSGKDIEIINALTGIRTGKHGVSEPATVILHVKATMRPFTREEVVAYATSPKIPYLLHPAGCPWQTVHGRFGYDKAACYRGSRFDG